MQAGVLRKSLDAAPELERVLASARITAPHSPANRPRRERGPRCRRRRRGCNPGRHLGAHCGTPLRYATSSSPIAPQRTPASVIP